MYLFQNCTKEPSPRSSGQEGWDENPARDRQPWKYLGNNHHVDMSLKWGMVTICPAAEQVVDDKEDAQCGKPDVENTIKNISHSIHPEPRSGFV